MAKRFFYVCAGMFLLALSYHLGATSAGAQSTYRVDGFTGLVPGSQANAVLENGDVYVRIGDSWRLNENIFGSATPVQTESFGSLKVRYR